MPAFYLRGYGKENATTNSNTLIQGDLVGDFIFDSGPPGSSLEGRVLHCRNAPSPGATSSLAIARMLANKMEETFMLPKRSNAKLY